MYNKGSIGVIPQEIRNKLIGKISTPLMILEKSFGKQLLIQTMRQNLTKEI